MTNLGIRKHPTHAWTAACVFLMSASAQAATVRLVYSFKSGGPAFPAAPLLWNGALLYGTSSLGGSHGQGTVFSVTPAGSERTLHSFGGPDGASPYSPVIAVGGRLCGTTSAGGLHQSSGTAYCVTKTGKETLLHSFNQHVQGTGAFAALLNVGNTLYSTATFGGDHPDNLGDGVVFALAPDGKLTTPLIFNNTDGSEPSSGLIKVGDTLYGTTYLGGKHASGTVFALSLTGHHSVLHDFALAPDGNAPSAGLIAVGNILYGTTGFGGKFGKGTIFKMDLGGHETVLHSFNGADGNDPQASLLDVKGILYGTTGAGGADNMGAIFTITPNGSYTLIYSFPRNGKTGAEPLASLVDVNGTLYGTAAKGGQGNGTVFSLTP